MMEAPIIDVIIYYLLIFATYRLLHSSLPLTRKVLSVPGALPPVLFHPLSPQRSDGQGKNMSRSL